MAKVVDPDKVWVPQATRGPLHDWAKFCDGQTWQLKRGEDFAADANLNSARSSFRQWAKRHGYDMTRVRTAVPDDDTLVIQVIGGPAAKVEFLERADQAERDGMPTSAAAWRASADAVDG